MTERYTNMTENEVQAILAGVLKHWESLTAAEIKGLFKILMLRGELPKCAACGKPIYNMDDFSWDHIIAESHGGPTVIGNLQPMHTWCNVAKGDETDDSYFCHVDPELLEQIIKNDKKKNSRSNGKTRKKRDVDTKRRKHVRIKGDSGVDISVYNKGYGRH